VSSVVGVILFAGVVLYGVFGGADFGAGFWDLTAGGAGAGRRPRALIQSAIGPVWEANHVWLIFCLVVLWTGFPSAFSALMTTLYIPLGLAALGIVLRSSGFAFRKELAGTEEQRVAGAAFASSSVVTPFFFGTIAGAIATGRVPGDAAAWVNPTSLLGGVLAVAARAYLAAVFLTAEARARRDPDLERWFVTRARAAAVVCGGLAVAGIFVLNSDAPRLFSHLTGRGAPFVALSAVAGVATVVAGDRLDPRTLRVLGVVAVGAVLIGWGVAQYPFLLGTHLSLSAAAAPSATLWSIVIVFAGAAVLCVPSLVALYVLQQREQLDAHA
jgi:cytochrome d ubiquinol oxidase subunit II